MVAGLSAGCVACDPRATSLSQLRGRQHLEAAAARRGARGARCRSQQVLNLVSGIGTCVRWPIRGRGRDAMRRSTAVGHNVDAIDRT
eukprot:SAG31_NODE_333_length_17527_cov_6.972056_2_plen_87_part_00